MANDGGSTSGAPPSEWLRREPIATTLTPTSRALSWSTRSVRTSRPTNTLALAALARSRLLHELDRIDFSKRPRSAQALYRLVGRVGGRAGISARVYPHLLRHDFGDHIARHAGIRNAQFLLGHADVGTTETYVGKPTLDELARAVAGFTFGALERAFSPLRDTGRKAAYSP